jgi:F-type H+-transporting ATPase subunit b
MDLNLTLLGQMLTFALFVWFTMRFVWPPVSQAMVDRQTKIAEGIAAGERGKHELDLAQNKASDMLRDAKNKAALIIDDANKRAIHIIDEAKENARVEADRLLMLNKSEIELEVQKAKQSLKNQVALIALAGAEKILASNIDKSANRALLDKLMTEI